MLDVREPHEFGEGHVAEAVNIPLGTLADQREDLPVGVRVVCVCRSGSRSARATAFLRDCGVDAVNLDGGMLAWHAEGHPLVDRHGDPGWVA